MSTYSYPQSQVIDEVVFKKTANGAIRAYLHARPDIDEPQVQTLLQILRDDDYECTPFTLDGKPTLEVRGFKNEKQLLNQLEKTQAITGAANHITDTQKPSFIDMIKGRSLQASGAFYTAGDINFITYGIKGKSWMDVAAGIAYALGTGSLVGYGRNDQSTIQVKDLSKLLAKHLMKESIKLPDNCALQAINRDKEKGLLANTNEFFERYPAEMFNLFTGIAGAFIAGAALKHKVLAPHPPHADIKSIKDLKISGWLDVGLGTMTMASTAIGGLVKEKAIDPDKPKEHGVKAVLEWIRERPLTIAGGGLMVSTMCHAVSTYKDYWTAKRMNDKQMMASVPWRAGFVISNLAAEFLVAISSKGHGEGVVTDKSVDQSMIALAADLIVRQPQHAQNGLIDEVATFLGRPDVLAMKDEEVKTALRQQVEAMRQNPWAVRPGAGFEKPTIQSPHPKDAQAWQAKLAAAAPAPQLLAP